MVLAMLLVLAGFIAAAFRISQGQGTDLPPGSGLCDVHRRKILPAIRSTGVLLIIASAAALLVPSGWSALPLTLGTIVLLIGASVFFPLYLKARRFDRATTALLTDPWIHWEYSQAQWQSWAAIQRLWERAGTRVFLFQRDWSKLLLPMAILAGASWILDDGGPGEKVSVFLGCVAVFLLAAGLLTWVARNEPEWRYRRMLAARPEAYLGADGIFCSGEYLPWILSGNPLAEAAALRDPPGRLVLSFDAFQGDGTTRVARLIPIPEGCEPDLDSLQQHLRRRCPKATVKLVAPASPPA
jgi:hypothetical protein